MWTENGRFKRLIKRNIEISLGLTSIKNWLTNPMRFVHLFMCLQLLKLQLNTTNTLIAIFIFVAFLSGRGLVNRSGQTLHCL